MRFRVELSREAQKQLARFPRDVRERLQRAIDEFEEKDDSLWSNLKALQGPEWKGRMRKTLGPYRIHLHEVPRPWGRRDLRQPHQVERHLPIVPKCGKRFARSDLIFLELHRRCRNFVPSRQPSAMLKVLTPAGSTSRAQLFSGKG